MPLTLLVIRVEKAALLVLLFAFVSTVIAQGLPADLTPESQQPLDLTARVPMDQQGYRGIPGQAWYGGGDPKVPDESRYQLPLEVRVQHLSANEQGDFILEILLRNAGGAPFDLPSQLNLTKVEQAGNKARHIFFFRVQSAMKDSRDAETVGFAATGGSKSLPDSFRRLDPGQVVRVLVSVSADNVARIFEQSKQPLVEVRVICNEWQLEDDRYFIRASSDEATSKTVIKFALQDGRPVAVEP